MNNPFKLLLGFFVYAGTLAILAAVGLVFWGMQEFKKPGSLPETVYFEVQRGDGLYNISHNLENEGIISNALVFQASAFILDAQNDLKAGEYEFPAHVSAQEVLSMIKSGKVVQRRITVREGLTSHEIVALLNEVEDLHGEISSTPAEGSLLPETYDYHKSDTRERLIGRMEQAMAEAIDKLWDNRAEGLPLKTKEEALILASIVEKETGVPSERRRVAGVFINRLHKNMPLQTDPTVIYALTQGKHQNEGQGPLGRRLLRKDLEFDSPYNTYKYAGLPPGPIANPGYASIEAVLQPEQHDYIYFVADGTGGHAFAKTLREHNANVAKWRKVRNSNR